MTAADVTTARSSRRLVASSSCSRWLGFSSRVPVIRQFAAIVAPVLLALVLDNFRAWLASLGIGPQEVATALAEISFSRVAELAPTTLAGLAATNSILLFLLFVVAFMALDAGGFASRLSTSAGNVRPSSAHSKRSHAVPAGAS